MFHRQFSNTLEMDILCNSILAPPITTITLSSKRNFSSYPFRISTFSKIPTNFTLEANKKNSSNIDPLLETQQLYTQDDEQAEEDFIFEDSIYDDDEDDEYFILDEDEDQQLYVTSYFDYCS